MRSAKGGMNVWLKRWQKYSCGVGIQGPIGKLGSRLRSARKRTAWMGGGCRRKWSISRWKVDPIPEEKGVLGCNRAVNLNLTVVDGGEEE